ncbi:unnamed protein product [Pleuronectes platessa]|uniref:Uncharacterized protein n=1 Tax=Pleuronectes platessa TaxID=8262 RepID=A0A9N7TNW9_PLEPL|nr:unnamed protein product [Pleuronectes platessa]
MEGRERRKREGVLCDGEAVCNTMGNCDDPPGESQPLLQERAGREEGEFLKVLRKGCVLSSVLPSLPSKGVQGGLQSRRYNGPTSSLCEVLQNTPKQSPAAAEEGWAGWQLDNIYRVTAGMLSVQPQSLWAIFRASDLGMTC